MRMVYSTAVATSILHDTLDSALDAASVKDTMLDYVVGAEEAEARRKQEELLLDLEQREQEQERLRQLAEQEQQRLQEQQEQEKLLRQKTEAKLAAAQQASEATTSWPEVTSSDGLKVKLTLSPKKPAKESKTQLPIKIRIPKAHVSPVKDKPSDSVPLKSPVVKIKPILKPAMPDTNECSAKLPCQELAVSPTDRKLKIRITKKTENLRIRLTNGRKCRAARIVKNSKLLKKKLARKRRLREKTKEKKDDKEDTEVKKEPPKVVSLVTVLKMSEIVSMKPIRNSLTTTQILEKCPATPLNTDLKQVALSSVGRSHNTS